MFTFCRFLRTQVGKKMLMALTGLSLSLFCLLHMAGNLLLFLGPEIYNLYSHKLTSNPLLIPAELGLVVMACVHVGLGIQLTLENRAARPVDYLSSAQNGPKGLSADTKYMILSGVLLGIFVIFHLFSFKYGPHYRAHYEGQEVRDLHRLVTENFRSSLFSAWYFFALIILGIHLSHGLKSFAQSLGFGTVTDKRWRRFAVGFAVIVAGGFIAQAFVMYALGRSQ